MRQPKGNKITDFEELVRGREYIVETDEPLALFDVGEFIGYAFNIGEDGGNIDEVVVAELGEGWRGRYPDAIFLNARVGDYFMFQAWEADTETDPRVSASLG